LFRLLCIRYEWRELTLFSVSRRNLVVVRMAEKKFWRRVSVGRKQAYRMHRIKQLANYLTLLNFSQYKINKTLRKRVPKLNYFVSMTLRCYQ